MCMNRGEKAVYSKRVSQCLQCMPTTQCSVLCSLYPRLLPIVCYLPGVLYYSTALQYVTQAREEPGSEVTVSPHAPTGVQYVQCGGKISLEKTFTNLWKKDFRRENFRGPVTGATKRCNAPKYCRENFTNGYKTSCSILCDTNCSVQLRQAQVFFQVITSACMVF